MYRIEFFNQALEPVDFAPLAESVQIVEDYVTLEQYEIEVPKLVSVEYGHIFRIMDGDKELTIGVVAEAEQTNATTRITAAPLVSLLDFETLEPVLQLYRALPYPPVWLNCASNQLFSSGNTSLQHHQKPYIKIYDTGAFLASALAVKCRDYIGSGVNDPTYTINDWDVRTTDAHTISNTTIDGVASDIAGLYDPDNNENNKYKTANVFDAFTASRSLEGRTFRAAFDFSGGRTRLKIYMRREPANTITIDADAPNIVNKEINIVTGAGAANRCVIYLCQSKSKYIDEIEVLRYYRHPDGTVDNNNTDTITPVIAVESWVDYDAKKTAAENRQYCDDLAAGALSIAEQENKINITVARDDKVLEFDTMRALSAATIMHNGRTYTAKYTGCKISGALVTYMFGDVRTELTSKLAIEARSKKGETDSAPFDPWDAAVPQGYALTSNNDLQAITGGSVSAVSAYGAYIIANVGGLGYTTVTRTNGQGAVKTIRYDGTITSATGATHTIDSGTKYVICHRTASTQAVLSVSFS